MLHYVIRHNAAQLILITLLTYGLMHCWGMMALFSHLANPKFTRDNCLSVFFMYSLHFVITRQLLVFCFCTLIELKHNQICIVLSNIFSGDCFVRGSLSYTCLNLKYILIVKFKIFRICTFLSFFFYPTILFLLFILCLN